MSDSGAMTSAVRSNRPAAGWYPDPADSRSMRWWDGSCWTEHTRQIAPTPLAVSADALPTRRSLRAAEAASIASGSSSAGSSAVTTLEHETPLNVAQVEAVQPAATPMPPLLFEAQRATAGDGLDDKPVRIPPLLRVQGSSQTVPGWLVAVSPVWVSLVTLAIIMPSLSNVASSGVSLLAMAGAIAAFVVIVFLVRWDGSTLRDRGHAAPTAWAILAPLIYFIVRVVQVGRASAWMLVAFIVSSVLSQVILFVALWSQLSPLSPTVY